MNAFDSLMGGFANALAGSGDEGGFSFEALAHGAVISSGVIGGDGDGSMPRSSPEQVFKK